MMTLIPTLLWLAAGLIFFASYRLTVRRLAAAQLLRIETAERAYAELLAGSNERDALMSSERQYWTARALSAEADADRLAPIVAQYVKDIDATAALLKDETPPSLTAEREALRLHQSALELRTHETHTEKV